MSSPVQEDGEVLFKQRIGSQSDINELIQAHDTLGAGCDRGKDPTRLQHSSDQGYLIDTVVLLVPKMIGVMNCLLFRIFCASRVPGTFGFVIVIVHAEFARRRP